MKQKYNIPKQIVAQIIRNICNYFPNNEFWIYLFTFVHNYKALIPIFVYQIFKTKLVMKNVMLALSFLIFGCQISVAQNNFTADFETFDSTPYYFRFGNNTNVSFYPRWKYSHLISDNPLVNLLNNSSKVLKYSTLDARTYGLKFLFPAPLNLDDIDTLSFDIFQPANIVGKAVNSTYSSTMATTQEIRVKLLTYFNTIQDSREDAGVVLSFTGAILPYTTVGQWVKYQVVVNPSKFAAADLTKLTTGVVGMAILPTYNSGVTLQTEHVCYLDNIRTRQTIVTNSVASIERSKLKINYANGEIKFNSEIEFKGSLNLYDVKGSLVSNLVKGQIQRGTHSFSPKLSAGVYFVSILVNDRFHNFKIVVQ
jgi:hypothetical protein